MNPGQIPDLNSQQGQSLRDVANARQDPARLLEPSGARERRRDHDAPDARERCGFESSFGVFYRDACIGPDAAAFDRSQVRIGIWLGARVVASREHEVEVLQQACVLVDEIKMILSRAGHHAHHVAAVQRLERLGDAGNRARLLAEQARATYERASPRRRRELEEVRRWLAARDENKTASK